MVSLFHETKAELRDTLPPASPMSLTDPLCELKVSRWRGRLEGKGCKGACLMAPSPSLFLLGLILLPWAGPEVQSARHAHLAARLLAAHAPFVQRDGLMRAVRTSQFSLRGSSLLL